MGGGGGGSRYTGPTSEHIKRKIEEARQREKKRLIGEVNELLKKRLVNYNDRDIERINKRLDQILNKLGDAVELETILFGGSVAKQTAIQGLSDVDALAIMNDDALAKNEPQKVLDLFVDTIRKKLPRRDIESIEKGSLAVTMKYKDGSEIQILPAFRVGKKIKISSSDGKSWIKANPEVFCEKLTTANHQMNQALIPAIKLFKGIVADLPRKKQITGYHAEALAIDAIKDYTGDKTPRALVLEILKHASQRILSPIGIYNIC
jgi:hypothetical protein